MSNPRISLAHPIGNPFARNAALALWEKGLLQEVVTAIAYDPETPLGKFLQRLPKQVAHPLTQELGRRAWLSSPAIPVASYPWRELVRIGLTRTGAHRSLGLTAQGLVDWVYRSIDHTVAYHHLQDIQGIYAYEDGAATTFQVAQAQGIKCFYDLPILFYETCYKIQTEESERFPDLAPALQSLQEPPGKLQRKHQEIQLADHIIVASSVTRQSLLDAGVDKERITVIPYGAPIEYFHPRKSVQAPDADPRFRALFVGRVGPRKGVHYLLQAWQQWQRPETELWLVGVNEFPFQWLGKYEGSFRAVPSVPHALLDRYYQAADVFIFPSLIEGFGLVLLEAMACGIPVITTPNTAGPDMITDGVEGFIVPIRDPDALQDRLEWCYTHREALAEMGQAARRKAEQLSWSLYRQRLGQTVQQVLDAPA